MKIALLSCLFFTGQPCIPGAQRVVMWQPTDTWTHDGADVLMAHVEHGKNADYSTKPGRLNAQQKINAIVSKASTQYPTVPIYLYGWHGLRWQEKAAAGNGKDKKAAQKAIAQWEADTRDIAAMGIPGKGCKGVFFDCYDFSDIAEVWKVRVTRGIKLWQSLGYDVIPIVTLRWMDTMQPYDEATARERIAFVAALCGGRCCIYDDGVNAQGRKMNYADWSLRAVVESIARGDK